MNPATLHFECAAEGGDVVLRVAHEGLAGPEGGGRGPFWWRALGRTDVRAPAIVDSFVAPIALYAQMHGQDLRVRGAMSRPGLLNLGRLLEVRRCTSPERMPRVIALEPDTVCDPVREEPDPPAAVALSGGVDSTFAAVRHGLRLLGDASHKLGGLVMVHGTDAPLTEPAGFAGMLRRAEPVARRTGAPILPVATNAMRLGWPYWPQQATPLVAASIAMFSDRIGVALIGGGLPYSAGRVGYGAPPIFDHLCSNALLRVVSDGAELGRAAKLQQLLPYPEIVASLKFCTSNMGGGGDSSRNCGRCAKCITTYVNFRAIGVREPPCFETPVDETLVSQLWAASAYDGRDFAMGWEDLVAYGATGPLVDRMRRVMARLPPRPFWKHVGKALIPRPVREALFKRIW